MKSVFCAGPFHELNMLVHAELPNPYPWRGEGAARNRGWGEAFSAQILEYLISSRLRGIALCLILGCLPRFLPGVNASFVDLTFDTPLDNVHTDLTLLLNILSLIDFSI